MDLKERKTEKEEQKRQRVGKREEKEGRKERKEEVSPVLTEDNKEMARLKDVDVSSKKREKLYIPVRV